MNTVICLENIRSLFNIGAIFRTCSFYGFYNVILLGYTGKTPDKTGATILHPEILKTSLGSEKDLNIIMLKDTEKLIDYAKNNNLEIISIEQTPESMDIHKYIKNKNTDAKNVFEDKIVVFGNEATGVTEETLRASIKNLELPKLGVHNSLNVTTTCGIVLDIMAQHKNKK